MTLDQVSRTKSWSLKVLALVIAIMFVCFVVLSIQVQRRNKNLAKIEKATHEISLIVTNFKKEQDSQANVASRKSIIDSLASIKRIEQSLEELKKEVKNQ